MKPPHLLALAALSLLSRPAAAQTTEARLLSIAVPLPEAVPGPEPVLLHQTSTDGRWLLITATIDHLLPGDHNAAPDVFLLNRVTGQLTLVSATPDGRAGDGASVAGGLSADGTRVAFVSRATDLVSADTNGTWEVLVRDMTAARTVRAAVTSSGAGSWQPSTEPWISADGTRAFFLSLDPNLAPGGVFATFNVFRRGLLAGQTDCLTTNAPVPPANIAWRLTEFGVTPDGLGLVMAAQRASAALPTNVIAVVDSSTAPAISALVTAPPEFQTGKARHAAVVLSANRRFVAFQSQSEVTNQVIRRGVGLHDLRDGTTALLTLQTNLPAEDRFPNAAHRPQITDEGTHVLYAAPAPVDYSIAPGLRVPQPAQLHLYSVASGTTRLVSLGHEGAPASADVLEARLAPDGRGVAFASRATNLVAGAVTERQRLYWWNRLTDTLTVAADLDEAPPAGRFVVSPDGQWVVSVRTEANGLPVFSWFNTGDGSVTRIEPSPAANQSSSGHGWIGIQPAGVTADGRQVVITAFPPGERAGSSSHQQVYLVDTATGNRQFLSQGTDLAPANGHGSPPAISSDGSTILLYSGASNLVPGDTDGRSELFVGRMQGVTWSRLPGSNLPEGSQPQLSGQLSPSGTWAFVTFSENGRAVARLASLTQPAISAAFPNPVRGTPAFSQSSDHFAVSVSSVDNQIANPRVEVHNATAWLAAGATPPAPLWQSGINGIEPRFDARGARLAYFHSPTAPNADRALMVVDWAQHRLLLSNTVIRATFSPPALSADGARVAWISPLATSNSTLQAWVADVDGGNARLASVAPDGTTPANGNSKSADLSADGRYVAFASLADNLVPNDTNRAKDVFLRDLATDQTLLVSRTPEGSTAAGWSLQPFFSADGRSLFFVSYASDLVPADYNQCLDLFKVDIVSNEGPLVVLQRDLLTGQAQLLWNATPGKLYGIESQDDLGSAWARLPGQFTGGAPLDLDPTAASRRFFRVLELP